MVAKNEQPVRHLRLGRIVATPGAIQAMHEADERAACLLCRHAQGDWGDVPAEDAEENERSLVEGYRVMSVYTLPKTNVKIWVITESDRSVTTLLLPEDY